jgi:hypothetical protein
MCNDGAYDEVWRNLAFGGSQESGGLLRFGVFRRDLASVAVKMFPIYSTI